MFVILWEFHIRPKSRPAFLRAYGNRGAWVRLFRRAPGYIGTRLLRDPEASTKFFTIDLWRSRAAFANAKKHFAAEYHELDLACEKLTRLERRIGSFEV